MDRKILVSLISTALVVFCLWFWSWCQPEKQVRRAQERLLSAVESRDFDAMAPLLSHDYRDRWGHDKAIVLSRCREVFRQFALLDIEREDRGLVFAGGAWVLSEKIRIKGLGAPLALHVRDEVNGLVSPFAMTWRKRGWKPWEWELANVVHPELKIQ